MKPIAITAVLAALLGIGLFLASAETRPRIEESEKPPTATADDIAVRQTLQARGAYLSRIGNCMGCHTAQGGRPYAGGASPRYLHRHVHYAKHYTRFGNRDRALE